MLVYDVSGNSWSSGEDNTKISTSNSAVASSNKVYFSGGSGGNGVPKTLFSYIP